MRQLSCAEIVLAIMLILTSGCASVKVHKVGSTDEKDDGLHFYMPRPYVDIHEPFIVSGRSYIVGGELTPDGQYVLINDWDASLNSLIHSKVGTKIDASQVVVTPQASGAIPPSRVKGGAQAKVLDGGAEEAPKDSKADKGSGETEPSESTKEAEQGKGKNDTSAAAPQKTGMLNMKVGNDNQAYAITPTKRYFDIVWIPDFEQEYVVKGRAGLGNAAIDIKMGQGWSLQGLDATADNSALAGATVDLIKTAMKDLYGLAAGRIGLPSALVGGKSGAQGAFKAEFAGGTKLSIRISVVKVAAPGLYPILKPAELECLTRAPKTSERCLDKTIYDALRGTSEIFVPTPPLTNIAFNTYELIVVEAAKASGDSITGISRYFDKSVTPPSESSGKSAGNTTKPMTSTQDKLDQVVRKLNQELKKADGAYWQLGPIAAKQAEEGYTLRINPVKGSPAMSEEAVKALLKKYLQQEQTEVSLDDIDVSFAKP